MASQFANEFRWHLVGLFACCAVETHRSFENNLRLAWLMSKTTFSQFRCFYKIPVRCYISRSTAEAGLGFFAPQPIARMIFSFDFRHESHGHLLRPPLSIFFFTLSSSSASFTAGAKGGENLPRSDIDLLEFPLNREYLEAEFFFFGAFGYGLVK
ncbi:hypothetical protein KSP40_PGU002577 [Platanthera guangdongensis]|uniref:Uncharacterized protein n=1 Tax=Platanthera guangdongensis TaxID=2320717 RepID=A0ABR2M5U1_9ASPA